MMTEGASLEEHINQIGNPVDMLRNSPLGPFPFPVEPEYSNWRDEQRAWRETAAMQDMSYHMTEFFFEGPDVYKLLSKVGVNSFAKFGPMQAKQLVCINNNGYMIGDAILCCHAEHKISIVGMPVVPNWVAYNAETGGYDVEVTRDESSFTNPNERILFRFQLQGPTAQKILECANGGPLPEIKFFKMGKFKIGEYEVTALNHRMSGAPGFEFWGPKKYGDAVKEILIEAGANLGLRQMGARVYPSTAVESGWIPAAVPAIYTGEDMKSYREWLPARSFEGLASLGGSYVSNNIEDYYVTPWDMGYGSFIKFDHDFIGAEALRKMENEPHKKKVWLSWNKDDVLKVCASQFNDGDRFKYMEMPSAHYATLPFDSVMIGDKLVGLSTYPAYSANLGGWISLAMMDQASAEPGADVTIIWGEEDGGTNKPTVERHIQTTIRATVREKPYTKS